jgi:hypothetical protein
MKNIAVLFFSLFSLPFLSSQSYGIKGTIKDTLSQTLPGAMVMLMDTDSILVDYTLSNDQGVFEFSSLTTKACIIKVTYLGYFPVTINVKYEGKNKIDLGIIRMNEIAKELMEVVIKEARAPLRMRGDTVEYDASQFKVPQGSTLEDLLRRLPGISVSQDGALEADGKAVTKLTVDGKTFFSEDPKFAIKNLPAAGVSKVQVFDKKNEEALLTGKSMPSQEKTMDIALKEEFKKGGFGKMTVAAGSDSESRVELKGNYNKFDKKNQLSFIGIGTNTGRNGLSWEDQSEFMGSNSFSFENNDYGFGGGGFINIRMMFSGGSELESKVSDALVNSNTSGFPTYMMGGVNYNYDDKKNKFSGRYFYKNATNERTTISDSRSFLNNFFLDKLSTDSNNKDGFNHRMETKYEYKIDSFLTAIVTADMALVESGTTFGGNNSIRRDGRILTSSNTYDHKTDLKGKLLNTSLLLRKTFRKVGRGIGINSTIQKTDINEYQKRFSNNAFYDESGIQDSLFLQRQINNSDLDKYSIQANAMYSEPLSKLFFLKIFYNLSFWDEDGSKIVNDQNQTDNALVQNNALSRISKNTITKQRSGTQLTFSYKSFNFSSGLAYQTIDLIGNYKSPDVTLFAGKVDNHFKIWVPYFEIGGKIIRNSFINVSYNRYANQPDIKSLIPVVDITNPLYITEGNPLLNPSIDHSIYAYFNQRFPAKGASINVNVSQSYNENQIIQQQTVDENLVTRSKPINYSGGQNTWISVSGGFPIVRNKLKVNTGLSLSTNRSFSFVNTILNNTKSNRWGPRINFDFTPSQKVAIYLSANTSFTTTTYNIHTAQNQNLVNQNYSLDINTNFAKGWYWNSKFQYSNYKNDRFGLDRSIPILDFSVYKQVLRGNKGEIRLSLYDAFNKRIEISQSASVSSVFNSRTPTIARYIMLSFSYNIKGMKSSVDKSGMFF